MGTTVILPEQTLQERRAQWRAETALLRAHAAARREQVGERVAGSRRRCAESRALLDLGAGARTQAPLSGDVLQLGPQPRGRRSTTP